MTAPLAPASVLLTALGVAAALLATRAGRPWAYGGAKAVASLGFLGTAVAAYVVVLAAMAATGLAAGVAGAGARLALGALLVAGSDLAVARQRFVAAAFANKLVGLPAYYLGQTLVALALAPAVS